MYLSSIVESHWKMNNAHLVDLLDQSEWLAEGWRKDDARIRKLQIGATVEHAVQQFLAHGGAAHVENERIKSRPVG